MPFIGIENKLKRGQPDFSGSPFLFSGLLSDFPMYGIFPRVYGNCTNDFIAAYGCVKAGIVRGGTGMIRDNFYGITDFQVRCAGNKYFSDFLGKAGERQFRMAHDAPVTLDGRAAMRSLVQAEAFGTGIAEEPVCGGMRYNCGKHTQSAVLFLSLIHI